MKNIPEKGMAGVGGVERGHRATGACLSTMKVIFVYGFVSMFFFVFVFVFVPLNFEGDLFHCILFSTMQGRGSMLFTIFGMFEKFVLQAVFLQPGLNTAALGGM